MRLLLMISIMSAFLLSAGVITYTFFGNNTAIAAESGGHPAKSGKHGKNDNQFQFVEITPLMFPLIDRNGTNQIITLVVSIEVKNSEGAEKVTLLTPRLNDAYIQDLYGYLSQYAKMNGGRVEISEVKKRLNRVTARVIGEEHFNDVLLQVVQQRPI